MFSEKGRKKRSGITRFICRSPVFLLALAVLILGAAVPAGWSGEHNVEEFDDAQVFFEFNSTDLDLGIQLFFDAIGWEKVKVTGPNGTTFKVKNGGSLKQLGSTEVFTESAEPTLDEDNLAEAIQAFLDMFPPGEYTFDGKTIDGRKLEGEAMLTHHLPAAVSINAAGWPVVQWIDNSGAGDPAIIGYEAVAEMVVADDVVEERVFVNTATFPASVTSFTVSPEFANLAAVSEAAGELMELKIEVIAIEASGNKTITEEILFEAD